jgi:hypothetical protein
MPITHRLFRSIKPSRSSPAQRGPSPRGSSGCFEFLMFVW